MKNGITDWVQSGTLVAMSGGSKDGALGLGAAFSLESMERLPRALLLGLAGDVLIPPRGSTDPVSGGSMDNLGQLPDRTSIWWKFWFHLDPSCWAPG